MASSEPLMGSIALFAGNFAPRGYALCQGQILSIAQNSALFAILGTTYGGNGQTTFALPNLSSRTSVGAGTGPGLPAVQLGEVAGNTSVTLTTSQMPMHNHMLTGNSGISDAAAPAPNVVLSSGGDAGTPLTLYSSAAPNTNLSPQSIGMAGSGLPVGIQNPFLGLNYIIATEGIFPSRN